MEERRWVVLLAWMDGWNSSFWLGFYGYELRGLSHFSFYSLIKRWESIGSFGVLFLLLILVALFLTFNITYTSLCDVTTLGHSCWVPFSDVIYPGFIFSKISG